MEAFAGRYCRCNPAAFAHEDAAYILAFAVIMLNTDLHNPAMKGRRMTLEDFIKMGTSAKEAASLTRDFLEKIFYSIQNEEIAMSGPNTPAAATKEENKPANVGAKLTAAFESLAMPWKKREASKSTSVLKSETLLAKTSALFGGNTPAETFVEANSAGLARPMLEAAGSSIVSAIAAVFGVANSSPLLEGDATPPSDDASAPLECAYALVQLSCALELKPLRKVCRVNLIVFFKVFITSISTL
jgi:Sec7-like guanine-nucleotide exchange factor